MTIINHMAGWGRHSLNLYSFVFSLNIKLNTKWYVPKVFLSLFVDGMVTAQTLARRYAIPPHFEPWFTGSLIVLEFRLGLKPGLESVFSRTCTQTQTQTF